MNADREVGVRPRGVGRPPRREWMAGPGGGVVAASATTLTLGEDGTVFANLAL